MPGLLVRLQHQLLKLTLRVPPALRVRGSDSVVAHVRMRPQRIGCREEPGLVLLIGDDDLDADGDQVLTRSQYFS